MVLYTVLSFVVQRSRVARCNVGSRSLYSAAALSSGPYSEAAGLDQVSSISLSSRSRTKGGREKGRVLACGAARRCLF